MTKQQPPVNLDLSSAHDVVCDNCGNYTFNEVVLMKRISAILSPTGKDAIVPIPTFACNACGFINKQFLPVKMTENEDTPQENTSRLTLEK